MAVIKRIGDILIENGMITADQLSDALDKKLPGERVGQTLVRLKLISEGQILKVLEASTGIERVTLAKVDIDETALPLIDEAFARQKKVLPLHVDTQKGVLDIVINDPLDFGIIEDVRIVTGYKPKAFSATLQEIDAAIEKYYGFSRVMNQLGADGANKNTEIINGDGEGDENENDETPIVQLVNQILAAAVYQRASDIHIDPLDNKIIVRYRIDGVLDTVRELPIRIQTQLISRIKVMSGMDITEARIPQDGRIQTIINGKHVDLRISTLPTVRGEKTVMRILDLSGSENHIKDLQLIKSDEDKIRGMISLPNGIILVSGPTGSGKTTTLYACLNELNTPAVNIITVEDPVEIKVEGINQVQTQAEVNMTFASALRAILRQDPNVVMVGEIRDVETANIAVRASLTGHLVLSTIHTNDAVRTVTRLLDMGVEPFQISSSLAGVIAQRLVRRLCDECKYEDAVTAQEKIVFEKYGFKNVTKIFRKKGCASCNNKGYRGRAGIFEILVLDDEMRRLINQNADVLDLQEAARRSGMMTLMQSGLNKILLGITTFEEVMRVATGD
ncbi:MAG: Flp pilus assembly complex ATPase component TadA [Acholeplasmatales bacterium]|nr:Flp pilus assembly complex ATPase component TadA [Acholeplasmatales bacterium]